MCHLEVNNSGTLLAFYSLLIALNCNILQRGKSAKLLDNLKNSPELLPQITDCRNQWRLLELKEPTEQSTPPDLTRYRVIPCTCGLTACAYCRKRIFHELRKKLHKKGIDQNWFMFTFSGVHHYGEESEDLKRLEVSFRQLIQHIQRKHKKIEYFAVKELSPKGNWHFHGYWNIWLDWYELREVWFRYSGSKSVYLKRVFSGEGAINYSISYLLKNKNFQLEGYTLHANKSKKYSNSKHFFQKETAPKLYKEAIISRNELQFFVPALREFIKNNNISKDQISFKDFPYESELTENFQTSNNAVFDNRPEDFTPLDLIF